MAQASLIVDLLSLGTDGLGLMRFFASLVLSYVSAHLENLNQPCRNLTTREFQVGISSGGSFYIRRLVNIAIVMSACPSPVCQLNLGLSVPVSMDWLADRTRHDVALEYKDCRFLENNIYQSGNSEHSYLVPDHRAVGLGG